MTPFIINQYNHYFYLTKELVHMMKGQELTNCRCFDTFEEYYKAVQELFPDVGSEEELHGSYIELYYDDEIDKAIAEHSFLDVEFNIDTLAQEISEYHPEG